MKNQQERIKQLYENGILSQGEMDAELKKLAKQKKVRIRKQLIWWLLGTIAVVCIGLIAWKVLDIAQTIEETYYENPQWDETYIESPQWEISDLNGSTAIQTQLFNPQYGILQIAFGKNKSCRVGLFDNDFSPKNVNGMMLGFIMKDDEFGKTFFNPDRKANYLYYNDMSHYMNNLFDLLDSGKLKYLTIERIDEDGFCDDSVHYRWQIDLKPGEFSKMIKG